MDRLISRARRSWSEFTVAVGLVLFLLAIGAAWLDGILGQVFSTYYLPRLFWYPAGILYILVVAPPVGQATHHAVQALRQLVASDDDGDDGGEERFDRLVSQASSAAPTSRWVGFGIGAAISLWIWRPWGLSSWIHLYRVLASTLMFGMLGWVISAGLAQANVMAMLHRQVSDVDILDLKAFAPIGRHSLVSALAFLGGGVVSMVFWGFEFPTEVEGLFLYGMLVVVATLVFFVPMRQTHRLMDAAKDRELESVQRHIVVAYRSLRGLSAKSDELGTLSRELDLWLAYERRVKALSTWPYNLGMLRTFLVSALSPVAISLVQGLIRRLLNL